MFIYTFLPSKFESIREAKQEGLELQHTQQLIDFGIVSLPTQ